MTCLAAYMVDYTNYYCHKAVFIVDLYACLSTDFLKLSITLSQKLASHYVGHFKLK